MTAPTLGRWVLALLPVVLLGAAQTSLKAQSPIGGSTVSASAPSLVFDPRVSDNLALLYHRFAPDEYAVCLLTRRVANAYLVEDFAMPPQERISILVGQMKQTGLKVKDGICGNEYGSRVTLHSHPADDRDDYCYAGPTDTVTTVLRTKDEYLAIICARGILWWHRSQLVAGDTAYPIDGQVIPMPGKWSP